MLAIDRRKAWQIQLGIIFTPMISNDQRSLSLTTHNCFNPFFWSNTNNNNKTFFPSIVKSVSIKTDKREREKINSNSPNSKLDCHSLGMTITHIRNHKFQFDYEAKNKHFRADSSNFDLYSFLVAKIMG